MQFHVTYEIVTPESAEHGDMAESGYVTPGEWHHELPADCFGPAAAAFKSDHALTLREAIGLVGCVESSDGLSFYECDGRDDYRTGHNERRALHCPRNISAASLRRVARLLNT